MKDEKQIKEEILKVIETRGEQIEAAAKELAPDFDYEKEKARLELEEKYGPLPEPPREERKGFNFGYVPKSKLGKTLMSDKNKLVLFTIFMLLILTIAIETTKYAVPQHITVTYKSFDEGEIVKEYDVRSTTVRDALEEVGIEIGVGDYVSPIADAKCADDMTIEIKKAKLTSAEIAGKNQVFYLVPGTVRENLTNNNVSFDLDDIVTPELSTEVAADTKIVFKEVHSKSYTKKEEEQPRSIVKLDPTLTSGVKEVVEGSPGSGLFEYKTTYINGVESGTERIVKKWYKKPVDNAVRLGTSLTGTTGEYTIAQEFTAECTAYWMGDNAVGAAGGRCRYGTCAVDRSVFPYGTLFWIEGYGDAIANDCGTAIKGHILDLWMHDFDESCRWGRRHVQAYVLK